MDHVGEAARPTTVEATDLDYNSTVFTHLVRSVPVAMFHREPEAGVAYANIGVVWLWRQPGLVGVVLLVGPQLPSAVVPVHDNYYVYYAWQVRPGAGGGVFIAPLPDVVGVVFGGLDNFAQQILPGIGIGYDGSAALADDLGAVYDDPVMHRLLAFVGIGASSVAVNGLAACPDSPVVAFHLFVLLLAGLFLVILHVLRV